MRTIALRLAVVGAAALAAIGATPALSAEPMPCRGLSFTDTDETAANRDIREGWFSFSEGRLTANLRLEQVDQELEAGDGSASFVMYYGARHPDGTRGDPHYASATTDGTRWTFAYGDDNGDGEQGATTGAVQTGPNGVIEIAIPTVHAGERDTLIFVHARTFVRDAANVTGEVTDVAPDSGDSRGFGYGADFLVEPCPAPDPEPRREPDPDPQPEPEPPTGPAPGPQPEQGPSSPPVAPDDEPKSEPARFNLTVPRLRARSLGRARSFKVEVDPSASVRSFVVTLRRDGRTFARGHRASLDGPAKVKVAVRRRIRRGTYRLTLRGRTPEGEMVARALKVRVT